jgi:hypothetical protein
MAAPRAFPVPIQDAAARCDASATSCRPSDRPAGFFTGSYTQVAERAVLPRPRRDGRFDPLRVVVNRARVGADSTNYLGMGYDRGVLRPGPLPDGAWERTPAGGDIEVRLPWSLIGVTDPSSRHVGSRRLRRGRRRRHGGRASGSSWRSADDAGAWQTWPATGRRRDVASVHLADVGRAAATR